LLGPLLLHCKLIVARFDGGQLSSGYEILMLREIELLLGIADRLLPEWRALKIRNASCTASPRTRPAASRLSTPRSSRWRCRSS
jgi:hypothetical protein